MLKRTKPDEGYSRKAQCALSPMKVIPEKHSSH